MPNVPLDEERENRITDEIVVDCYDESEIAMGWYCYLQDRLEFPFEAEWFAAGKPRSQLVRAIGMADEEECQTHMCVEIEYCEGEIEDAISAPLEEIYPSGKSAQREEAIEDWRYWLEQGNSLVDPDEYDEEY
ncbi:MAG: calcium-binding protein [Cyanobacteriota bacterium]|nr:calcium-binding protein [Cyanobacteriota bacterium]